MWWAFKALVATHIAIGSVGLISFWVPVLSRKGSPAHRRWGRVFTYCMLMTGSVAIAISACTIVAPLETHPHLQDLGLVRGIFGWMMLYLAILTINLAWYGWLCVLNRTHYAANREWRNLALQGLVTLAAANCAFQGWLIGQPLMLGHLDRRLRHRGHQPALPLQGAAGPQRMAVRTSQGPRRRRDLGLHGLLRLRRRPDDAAAGPQPAALGRAADDRPQHHHLLQD